MTVLALWPLETVEGGGDTVEAVAAELVVEPSEFAVVGRDRLDGVEVEDVIDDDRDVE